MDAATARSQLLASLTTVTGVTNWENIAFSMRPTDDPTGYFTLIECEPNKTTQIFTFAVGIGVADVSLSGIYGQCDELVALIATAYGKQRQGCDGIAGQVGLLDPIRVEVPDSFPNQNVTSATEAFKTAITFAVQITAGY